MHRDLSMACPSDPHSTSSALERSTSAIVHQVSILRPKTAGHRAFRPNSASKQSFSLWIVMSLHSLLVISRTRLLSPRDPTGFDFLLHGVDLCSTQLLPAWSSTQPRCLSCGLATFITEGMLCVLDCLSFVFAMKPRCLCER